MLHKVHAYAIYNKSNLYKLYWLNVKLISLIIFISRMLFIQEGTIATESNNESNSMVGDWCHCRYRNEQQTA